MEEQMEKSAQGPQWAMVEIMGFRKHVGIVSEEQRFGATMMHLEALGADGTFETHYYGGSSIFGVTPLTEEAARRSVLPKSFHPCDAFIPSKVLPVACEDCGHDEGKHRPAFVLTQGVPANMRQEGDAMAAEVIAKALGEDQALVEEALAALHVDALVEPNEHGLFELIVEDDAEDLP